MINNPINKILESLNREYYRYDDHLYSPNDLIDIVDTKIRGISSYVLDAYTYEFDFDFRNGYIYMLDHYGDETFGHSMYLYKVRPIGKILAGNDNYSIDKCNDYIKGMYKTSDPDMSKISDVIDMYIDHYKNDKSGVISYIAPKCEVLQRINL